MNYLSVCSGIEAATVAWEPLGWSPVAFSEIERFPSAVLDHHYPTVPNWGDMTRFQEWPDAEPTILVGGPPVNHSQSRDSEQEWMIRVVTSPWSTIKLLADGNDGDLMFTLQATAQHAIAFHNSQDPDSGEVTHALGAKDNGLGVLNQMQVRRLTPRECERLQGFPDDYTLIPWRGRSTDQCPDGPRYKALGNSMAVPVMRWIGRRIEQVDAITQGM